MSDRKKSDQTPFSAAKASFSGALSPNVSANTAATAVAAQPSVSHGRSRSIRNVRKAPPVPESGIPLTLWASLFLLLSASIILGRWAGVLPSEIRVDDMVHAVEGKLGKSLGGALIGAAGRWQGVVDGAGAPTRVGPWALHFYRTR